MIKPMFENLGVTPKREPVLYLALLVVILNIVVQTLQGTTDLQTAIESIGIALAAFIARGQVTPVDR